MYVCMYVYLYVCMYVCMFESSRSLFNINLTKGINFVNNRDSCSCIRTLCRCGRSSVLYYIKDLP